jgi:hypothetical protein
LVTIPKDFAAQLNSLVVDLSCENQIKLTWSLPFLE